MGTVAPFLARSKQLGLVPPMLEPRVAVKSWGLSQSGKVQ